LSGWARCACEGSSTPGSDFMHPVRVAWPFCYSLSNRLNNGRKIPSPSERSARLAQAADRRPSGGGQWMTPAKALTRLSASPRACRAYGIRVGDPAAARVPKIGFVPPKRWLPPGLFVLHAHCVRFMPIARAAPRLEHTSSQACPCSPRLFCPGCGFCGHLSY